MDEYMPVIPMKSGRVRVPVYPDLSQKTVCAGKVWLLNKSAPHVKVPLHFHSNKRRINPRYGKSISAKKMLQTSPLSRLRNVSYADKGSPILPRYLPWNGVKVSKTFWGDGPQKV